MHFLRLQEFRRHAQILDFRVLAALCTRTEWTHTATNGAPTFLQVFMDISMVHVKKSVTCRIVAKLWFNKYCAPKESLFCVIVELLVCVYAEFDFLFSNCRSALLKHTFFLQCSNSRTRLDVRIQRNWQKGWILSRRQDLAYKRKQRVWIYDVNIC